jgi:hypothetical protein
MRQVGKKACDRWNSRESHDRYSFDLCNINLSNRGLTSVDEVDQIGSKACQESELGWIGFGCMEFLKSGLGSTTTNISVIKMLIDRDLVPFFQCLSTKAVQQTHN